MIHLIECDVVIAQDQQCMKEEVGHFINDLFTLAILCRQNDFSGFFRDFFENSVHPAVEEFRHVGFRLTDRFAFGDRVIDPLEDASGCRASFAFECWGFRVDSGKKTRSLSGMTGRTNRFGLDKNGIPIAVDEEVFDSKKMPRRFAFLPEFFPGTAPE